MNKFPPDSLHALGGDGRTIPVPEQHEKGVRILRELAPSFTAAICTQSTGYIREALNWLVDEDHLTDKQYEIIAQEFPDTLAELVDEVGMAFPQGEHPIIETVLKRCSTKTSEHVQGLLLWDLNESSEDVAA